MIKTFKNKETAKVFNREYSKKLPPHIQDQAVEQLWILNFSKNINDLRVPLSNHLEKLKGDRLGQYSIRINRQWRICFAWKENNAYNVEITDYH